MKIPDFLVSSNGSYFILGTQYYTTGKTLTNIIRSFTFNLQGNSTGTPGQDSYNRRDGDTGPFGMFGCSLCHKTFAHKRNLYRHQRESHADLATHFCVYCNKGFKDARGLGSHIVRTHAHLEMLNQPSTLN